MDSVPQPKPPEATRGPKKLNTKDPLFGKRRQESTNASHWVPRVGRPSGWRISSLSGAYPLGHGPRYFGGVVLGSPISPNRWCFRQELGGADWTETGSPCVSPCVPPERKLSQGNLS